MQRTLEGEGTVVEINSRELKKNGQWGKPKRLAIRSESPDFRLMAYPASPLPEKDSKDVPVWSPLLRRGGTAARAGVGMGG